MFYSGIDQHKRDSHITTYGPDGAIVDQERVLNTRLRFARQARAFSHGLNRLLGGATRITLHDMKTSALTVRLDRDLERQLARLARRTGRSRSELVREALRRQLALAEFQDLRRRIMPLAEARGYLTDEDVFRDVS